MLVQQKILKAYKKLIVIKLTIILIGKNYFLGVKLNSSNQATNAYACGVKDNIPFWKCSSA